MTSKERAKLRSLASTEPAIVQVGKAGINDSVIRSASEALEARELVKMSVLDNSGLTAREAAEEIAAGTGAEVVAAIGSKFVLYRKKEKDSRFGI